MIRYGQLISEPIFHLHKTDAHSQMVLIFAPRPYPNWQQLGRLLLVGWLVWQQLRLDWCGCLWTFCSCGWILFSSRSLLPHNDVRVLCDYIDLLTFLFRDHHVDESVKFFIGHASLVCIVGHLTTDVSRHVSLLSTNKICQILVDWSDGFYLGCRRPETDITQKVLSQCSCCLQQLWELSGNNPSLGRGDLLFSRGLRRERRYLVNCESRFDFSSGWIRQKKKDSPMLVATITNSNKPHCFPYLGIKWAYSFILPMTNIPPPVNTRSHLTWGQEWK